MGSQDVGGISTELLTDVVECPLFWVVVQLEGAMEFSEFVEGVFPEVWK